MVLEFLRMASAPILPNLLSTPLVPLCHKLLIDITLDRSVANDIPSRIWRFDERERYDIYFQKYVRVNGQEN